MTPEIVIEYPVRKKQTEVFIDEGLCFSPWFLQKCRAYGNHFAVIADSTVADLYGRKMISFFQQAGLKAELFSLPAGEENKNRAMKERIEDEMQRRGVGRDACLISLGGGVAGDLAGFIASTYCRGIPFVGVPTTLMAMADSSIGGKNGVNTPFGKNRVGTFYHPECVVMDLSFLETLPLREWRNGLAEIIKHALIASEELFIFLEEGGIKLREHKEKMKKIIKESGKIKQSIVQQDEKETGLRQLLNFGHTFAHALEALCGYQLMHGEAVALGAIAESYISWKMGYLPQNVLNRIISLFKSFEFPFSEYKGFSPEEMLSAMAYDKKSVAGMPRFVLLEKIGLAKTFSSAYSAHVPDPFLNETLQFLSYDLHRH